MHACKISFSSLCAAIVNFRYAYYILSYSRYREWLSWILKPGDGRWEFAAVLYTGGVIYKHGDPQVLPF